MEEETLGDAGGGEYGCVVSDVEFPSVEVVHVVYVYVD